MALNSDDLGDTWVQTYLDCLGTSPSATDLVKFRTLQRLLAKDLIDHFIARAEIESDGKTETHGVGAEADIVDLGGVIKA